MNNLKHLILNFRIVVTLCLFAFNCLSQEQTTLSTGDTLPRPNAFQFHFDIGLAAGFDALGDNYVTQGYDIKAGSDIATTIQYNKVSFHFDMQFYSSVVVDQEIVGAITRSRTSRISLGLGYNFELTPTVTLNPSINYGSISYRSNLPDSADFRDEGNTLSIDVKAVYNISPTFGFYMSLAYYRDQMEIRTTASQQDFFRNVSHLNPSIGVRFSSRAVRRKKGEPGDGIFTRRDGL